MKKLVLDPSAAYEIVLFRAKRTFLLGEMVEAKSIIAPDLFYSEAANVIWKMYQFEQKPLSDYELALQSAISLVDEFYASQLLWKKAFQLACEVEHPVYDCMYLQLALESQAKLLTVNKRLIKKAEELYIPVFRLVE